MSGAAQDETTSVVHAYIDACNGDDVSAVLDLLHPDVELHESKNVPGAVSAVGLEAVTRYLVGFEKHWTTFRWEANELRFAGKRALMRARLLLTGRQSGIEVDREWIYVFTVRDRMLIRQYGYDDLPSAEEALLND